MSASVVVLVAAAASWPRLNVEKFGAIGDGRTTNTDAFRRAMSSCEVAGGCQLIVPAGTFVTGPFNLTSNMHLLIEPNATVLGVSPDLNSTLSEVQALYPWVDRGCPGCPGCSGLGEGPIYHPLVYGVGLRNVTISGGGVMDGNGPVWWIWNNKPKGWIVHNASDPISPLLDGVDRGVLLHLMDVQGLTVRDVTLRRSPFWTFRLTRSSDVLIERVHVRARDPPYCPPHDPKGWCYRPCNEDGIDVESSVNVVIRDSDIYSYDDSISLKSGKVPHACLTPTRNVLIENVSLASNQAALAFGSATSGGIRNVTARNVRVGLPGFHGGWTPSDVPTGNAIIVKADRGRSNLAVEDIYVEDLEAGEVQSLLLLTMYYHEGIPPQPPQLTPVYRNMKFRNLRAARSGPLVLRGLPESHIEHVTIDNVAVAKLEGSSQAVNCSDVDHLAVSGLRANGSAVDVHCNTSK